MVLGFGFEKLVVYQQSQSVIFMPHWFVVLLAGSMVAAPWLRQLRRLRWSKRYSVRTLLIAITAVAMVLGLIGALRRWL
jgi:hypothetical protein